MNWGSNPPFNCRKCERLAAFLDTHRAEHPDWFNAPVPTFGDKNGSILIIGLAPGLKGANRTGRPFTGDFAGDLLYETLFKLRLATGNYEKTINDSLELRDIAITNAVRCVPPQNKPNGQEINNCQQYLLSTIEEMKNLKVFFALGRIAHDALLTILNKKKAAYPFSHGALHKVDDHYLVDSYHCSRYNTNTNRLTPDMFQKALSLAKKTAQEFPSASTYQA